MSRDYLLRKKLLYFRKILYVGLENKEISGIYFTLIHWLLLLTEFDWAEFFRPTDNPNEFKFMSVPSSGFAPEGNFFLWKRYLHFAEQL